MRALETIGVSLLIMAICVALLLFMMGGPYYRDDPRNRRWRLHRR
ncbi:MULTISPECIES: hypothetical protein [Streptomycetaceae]